MHRRRGKNVMAVKACGGVNAPGGGKTRREEESTGVAEIVAEGITDMASESVLLKVVDELFELMVQRVGGRQHSTALSPGWSRSSAVRIHRQRSHCLGARPLPARSVEVLAAT